MRSCSAFEGVLKELIHQLKYSGKDYLAKDLSLFLMRTWQKYPEIQEAEIAVPVPLHAASFRERGYNQSEVLAKAFSSSARILFSNALKRTRQTVSQTTLKQMERKKNVENAFTVSKPDAVKGKKCLLIDDVSTTCATLNSCSKALLAAGAKEVYALTLARNQ